MAEVGKLIKNQMDKMMGKDQKNYYQKETKFMAIFKSIAHAFFGPEGVGLEDLIRHQYRPERLPQEDLPAATLSSLFLSVMQAALIAATMVFIGWALGAGLIMKWVCGVIGVASLLGLRQSGHLFFAANIRQSEFDPSKEKGFEYFCPEYSLFKEGWKTESTWIKIQLCLGAMWSWPIILIQSLVRLVHYFVWPEKSPAILTVSPHQREPLEVESKENPKTQMLALLYRFPVMILGQLKNIIPVVKACLYLSVALFVLGLSFGGIAFFFKGPVFVFFSGLSNTLQTWALWPIQKAIPTVISWILIGLETLIGFILGSATAAAMKAFFMEFLITPIVAWAPAVFLSPVGLLIFFVIFQFYSFLKNRYARSDSSREIQNQIQKIEEARALSKDPGNIQIKPGQLPAAFGSAHVLPMQGQDPLIRLMMQNKNPLLKDQDHLNQVIYANQLNMRLQRFLNKPTKESFQAYQAEVFRLLALLQNSQTGHDIFSQDFLSKQNPAFQYIANQYLNYADPHLSITAAELAGYKETYIKKQSLKNEPSTAFQLAEGANYVHSTSQNQKFRALGFKEPKPDDQNPKDLLMFQCKEGYAVYGYWIDPENQTIGVSGTSNPNETMNTDGTVIQCHMTSQLGEVKGQPGVHQILGFGLGIMSTERGQVTQNLEKLIERLEQEDKGDSTSQLKKQASQFIEQSIIQMSNIDGHHALPIYLSREIQAIIRTFSSEQRRSLWNSIADNPRINDAMRLRILRALYPFLNVKKPTSEQLRDPKLMEDIDCMTQLPIKDQSGFDGFFEYLGKDVDPIDNDLPQKMQDRKNDIENVWQEFLAGVQQDKTTHETICSDIISHLNSAHNSKQDPYVQAYIEYMAAQRMLEKMDQEIKTWETGKTEEDKKNIKAKIEDAKKYYKGMQENALKTMHKRFNSRLKMPEMVWELFQEEKKQEIQVMRPSFFSVLYFQNQIFELWNINQVMNLGWVDQVVRLKSVYKWLGKPTPFQQPQQLEPGAGFFRKMTFGLKNSGLKLLFLIKSSGRIALFFIILPVRMVMGALHIPIHFFHVLIKSIKKLMKQLADLFDHCKTSYRRPAQNQKFLTKVSNFFKKAFWAVAMALLGLFKLLYRFLFAYYPSDRIDQALKAPQSSAVSTFSKEQYTQAVQFTEDKILNQIKELQQTKVPELLQEQEELALKTQTIKELGDVSQISVKISNLSQRKQQMDKEIQEITDQKTKLEGELKLTESQLSPEQIEKYQKTFEVENVLLSQTQQLSELKDEIRIANAKQDQILVERLTGDQQSLAQSIKSLKKQIPDSIDQQYSEYKQKKEEIQKLKQGIKIQQDHAQKIQTQLAEIKALDFTSLQTQSLQLQENIDQYQRTIQTIEQQIGQLPGGQKEKMQNLLLDLKFNVHLLQLESNLKLNQGVFKKFSDTVFLDVKDAQVRRHCKSLENLVIEYSNQRLDIIQDLKKPGITQDLIEQKKKVLEELDKKIADEKGSTLSLDSSSDMQSKIDSIVGMNYAIKKEFFETFTNVLTAEERLALDYQLKQQHNYMIGSINNPYAAWVNQNKTNQTLYGDKKKQAPTMQSWAEKKIKFISTTPPVDSSQIYVENPDQNDLLNKLSQNPNFSLSTAFNLETVNQNLLTLHGLQMELVQEQSNHQKRSLLNKHISELKNELTNDPKNWNAVSKKLVEIHHLLKSFKPMSEYAQWVAKIKQETDKIPADQQTPEMKGIISELDQTVDVLAQRASPADVLDRYADVQKEQAYQMILDDKQKKIQEIEQKALDSLNEVKNVSEEQLKPSPSSQKNSPALEKVVGELTKQVEKLQIELQVLKKGQPLQFQDNSSQFSLNQQEEDQKNQEKNLLFQDSLIQQSINQEKNSLYDQQNVFLDFQKSLLGIQNSQIKQNELKEKQNLFELDQFNRSESLSLQQKN